MGLYAQWSVEEGGCLAIWKMEESEEQLRAFLPVSVQEEADRLASLHRRMEWLAVRVLLLHLLDGRFVEIRYTSGGAPYLADSDCSISISHTKGYVAILLMKGVRRIGIDIEQWGEKVVRVASRFVRDDEQITSYRESVVASLLLHWSAKETLFKALEEQEGVDFKEHLRVSAFKVDVEGMFDGQEFRTAAARRYPVCYRLFADFVLTWTTGPFYLE